jgi:hypothetical protein
VLGHDRFKEKIEEMTSRRIAPKPKGGDRKSRAYKEKVKNEKINFGDGRKPDEAVFGPLLCQIYKPDIQKIGKAVGRPL